MGTLGQTPGELGPSTIVGSAAYNLFVITGVCMISVPEQDLKNGETGVRDISELGVFYITAFFSVFAYIWMLFCLDGFAPLTMQDGSQAGKIEIWEAIATFMLFPVLVGIAYAADRGALPCLSSGYEERDAARETKDLESKGRIGSDEEKVLGRALVPKTVGTKNVRAFNEDIKAAVSPEQLAILKAFDEADEEDKATFMQKNADKVAAQMALSAPGLSKKKSKMFWRVQAGKNAKGKPSVFDDMEKAKAGGETTARDKVKVTNAPIKYQGSRTKEQYEFNSSHYSVKEDGGHVTLHVHRNGDLSEASEVIYRTLDGTAKAGGKSDGDYEASKGVLKFNPGERTSMIMINIFHDKEVEENEIFYVELANESGGKFIDKAEVMIIDVSSVGTFSMRHANKKVNEACGMAKVWVERRGGSDGVVEIEYCTEAVDIGKDKVGQIVQAKPLDKDGNGDYKHTDASSPGILRFEQGEVIRPIEIPIMDNKVVGDVDRVFLVTINDAKLKDRDNKDPPIDGDRNTTVVSIQDDDDHFKFVNLVQVKLQERLLKFSIATATYQDQFLDAVEIDREHVSCMSYLLHCMSLPWKVIMAFIPPTDYWGGKLCFCVSLGATGVITAIVAELAGMFGCMLGISDSAVALTVVALGTSLPDTFASRLAIMYADDADAAVGNVTGSNSVNVFLGLGLPWCIAAFYASSPGNAWSDAPAPYTGYMVPTGSLGTSVAIFAPLAILCLSSLLFNRWMINGVVGGPPMYRSVGFCIYVGMWVFFLTMAIGMSG